MKEKVGVVFSIARNNAPVPGCTISKEVHGGENYITYFSLARNTDISAEIYPYYKMLIVADGFMEVYGADGFSKELRAGDSIVTYTGTPMGMRSAEGAVYTEISIRRMDIMNEAIKAGEVFKLAELVPYADGRIVNMDVVHNDKMKFVVMAFDEGTGLSEHAAPGEALIFALDGEGVIGYEGKEHTIKAGENFHFAKAALHSVKANKKFKMALLLTLEEKKGDTIMRAYVDQDMCIGCGLCEGTCPEVFRMNDDDKAEAYADTTEENRDAVLEAIDGCPVSAIREEE